MEVPHYTVLVGPFLHLATSEMSPLGYLYVAPSFLSPCMVACWVAYWEMLATGQGQYQCMLT